MDDRTARDLKEGWYKPAPPTVTPVSRRKRIFGWGVVLLVVAGVVWWINTRPVVQPAGGRFSGAGGAMSIVPATAVKGDIDIALNALGTVTSLSTVTVRTQISGQLINIDFREGQDVKKGDPIAEIDSRPYEAVLQQMQGQLARDQALFNNAQTDLTRYKALAANNAIPKQQYDTQEALVHQYEGTVLSDQAQVDTAKLNIAYCHIVAPAAGRVGLRQVDQGNYVTSGDANGIVVITLMQPINVIFTLPEDNLQPILDRIHAGAELSVTAYDRSAIKELATGKLMTLDNQIDTTTGTVKLKAQFANDKENLYPNQFVNIRLLVNTLHDATIVPSSAIQRGAPGTFVYLVNADSTVAVRVVELGPADGERQSIRKGLAPGDRVVIDGADKLRDGAKVVVRDESGNAQSAPANSGNPARGGGSGRRQGQQQQGAPSAPPAGAPAGPAQPGAPVGTPNGQ